VYKKLSHLEGKGSHDYHGETKPSEHIDQVGPRSQAVLRLHKFMSSSGCAQRPLAHTRSETFCLLCAHPFPYAWEGQCLSSSEHYL